MGKIVLLMIVILVLGYLGWNWDPNRPYDPDNDTFL